MSNFEVLNPTELSSLDRVKTWDKLFDKVVMWINHVGSIV